VANFTAYPIPGFSDPVSSLSHLLGAAFFAFLTPFLLRHGRGHAGRLFCLSVFAFSTVLLMSVSGVYHLLQKGGGGREVLLRLDLGAIYVLIAGTFTPVYGILFRGPGRWVSLLFVWLAAVAGIAFRTVFFDGFPELLSVTMYLGLGWFGVVAGAVLWRRYGAVFVLPLLYGGLAYSVGAILEFLRTPTLIGGIVGPHELFHLLVLLGAGCHWWFVFRLTDEVMPRRVEWTSAGSTDKITTSIA
jgi:channel protein (hemolysin III family)